MATQPTTARDKLRSFAPKLIELTDNVLFGDVWERPGLPSVTAASSPSPRSSRSTAPSSCAAISSAPSATA